MSKTMTLEVLSSIKGAKSSEAVEQLFEVIKKAKASERVNSAEHFTAVSLEDLRKDVVISSSEMERELIKKNFPLQKNGFLVVSKVIEE
jgi:Asp-tRNA(Asn)/Glu-tRNA(Gln) amidotransferase C subunit